MKLIIFTTCKSFEGDDAWRQEQAIKSWTILEGIEKKILIMGTDKGSKEICEKYNITHVPDVECFEGIPIVHSMFEIAAKNAEDDDILLWTNSDMIFFQDIVFNLYLFSNTFKQQNIKDYLLTGQRHDWFNPKILDMINVENFSKNSRLHPSTTTDIILTDSPHHEIGLHKSCGIDFIFHSKTTFVNKFDKKLVIAGTRHDMMLLGVAKEQKYFSCDLTNSLFVIHQNHGYGEAKSAEPNELAKINNERSNLLKKLSTNNQKGCRGTMMSIDETLFKTQYANNKIILIQNKK